MSLIFNDDKDNDDDDDDPKIKLQIIARSFTPRQFLGGIAEAEERSDVQVCRLQRHGHRQVNDESHRGSDHDVYFLLGQVM